MQEAIDETNRRRQIQMRYNEEHHIVPTSIIKEIRDLTDRVRVVAEPRAEYVVSKDIPKDELLRLIHELEKQMKAAAAQLEFEKAALLRDQIIELRRSLEDETIPEWERVRKMALPARKR
jgi:excinuclease ABC subunit B